MARALPDPDLGSPDSIGKLLEIRVVRDGNSVAVVLSGELDLASAERLEAVLQDAQRSGIGQIHVDLSEVSFIDSSGLSALLEAKKLSDGRLSCAPSRHEAVTRLMELTGTLEMLDPSPGLRPG